MEKTTIVWFRRDLRLIDNPALWSAAQRGHVVPVFIYAPHEEPDGYAGGAWSWWLHQSLSALQQSLQQIGSPLVIRSGDSLTVLKDLVRETGADALYFNARYECPARALDAKVAQYFRSAGLEVQRSHAVMLMKPGTIVTEAETPYKVFTAFWRQFVKRAVPRPVPAPRHLSRPDVVIDSTPLQQLHVLPRIRWYEKLSTYWDAGEQGALHKWTHFTSVGLDGYTSGRDVPAAPNVSQFSPYFAVGSLSPRVVWHQLMELRDAAGHQTSLHTATEDIESFLRQLVWREFAYDSMVAHPEMVTQPMRREFASFPWEDDPEALRRWQRGQTGYPLVDAGMRQLWETGWMHNRVRMVVASFLVKHLLISWREGANWFKDTLIDADVANNTMGWQWVTGCGFDAAPYFRIFNPVAQGEKFDADAAYIRQFVPELNRLPTRLIHRPWDAPNDILEAAGVNLGVTYPRPMINHAFARQRALDAYARMRHS